MNLMFEKLVIRFLSGNSNQADELSLIEQVENDEEKQNLLAEYQEVWDKIEEPEYLKEMKNYALAKARKRNMYVYLVAALILFFSIGVYIAVEPVTIVIQNTSNVVQKVDLPDESEVVLSPGAILKYKQSLAFGFNRRVSIEGQAFFRIHKDKGKKFMVACSGLDISVLGTQFNVAQTSDRVLVTLREGKVLLRANEQQAVLYPGEQAIYSKEQQEITVRRVNPEVYTYWMESKIYFDKYSMDDLADIFRIYYDKILIFDSEETVKKHIGGSAPSDDYKLILDALAIITESNYTITGDTIYINKKNR